MFTSLGWLLFDLSFYGGDWGNYVGRSAANPQLPRFSLLHRILQGAYGPAMIVQQHEFRIQIADFQLFVLNFFPIF